MSRVAIVVGGCLLCVHVFLMLRTWRFQATATRARGVVVGFDVVIDAERNGDTGSASHRYYAEVEFWTPDGAKHRFTSSGGQSAPQYRRGEVINVLYPANHPDKAEVESFTAIWAGPIVLGMFGVACLAGGVWEWRRERRERQYTVGTVVRLRG